MKLLDDYKLSRQKLFDYFGYVENWAVIPIDDATAYYWRVKDDEVQFSNLKISMLNDKPHYSNEIYYQRFLDKHIYRGDNYTMICVDTHVDGNKFLQIFDNFKEINA